MSMTIAISCSEKKATVSALGYREHQSAGEFWLHRLKDLIRVRRRRHRHLLDMESFLHGLN